MSTSVLERPDVEVAPESPEEREPVGEMPSSLLRRGACYYVQGRGQLWDRQARTTCALGALYLGAVGADYFAQARHDIDLDALVRERTGVSLTAQRVVVPGAGLTAHDYALRLKDAIVYLNDRDGWSYEHIARWLERQGL